MEKHMVECEDGRVRQARVYGVPKDEGDFEIKQAGVRLRGKHVIGEAWHSRKTGTWYFLTDPNCKFSGLLPRCRERPIEPDSLLEVSLRVRDR